MKRTWVKRLIIVSCCITASFAFQGCKKEKDSSVTEIEIVQYKPEAASYFEELEDEFNTLHDDIHLTINSPNDANAILRTRFIREDYPDIIGVGGDINYSYYMDAEIFADISDYEGLKKMKQALMKHWNWCRWTEFMQFLMPQMQQESYTIKICSKSMDGRFREIGRN